MLILLFIEFAGGFGWERYAEGRLARFMVAAAKSYGILAGRIFADHFSEPGKLVDTSTFPAVSDML